MKFAKDFSKSLALPLNDVDNWELVGKKLLCFVSNCAAFQVLKDKDFSKGASDVFIEMFSKIYFNEVPQTKNLIPWFMHRVGSDLSCIKGFNKIRLEKFIDKLYQLDGAHLEQLSQLSAKYNVNSDELKLKGLGLLKDKITEKSDLNRCSFSVFADAIFCLEIGIFQYYYEEWFNEPYLLKGIGRRGIGGAAS